MCMKKRSEAALTDAADDRLLMRRTTMKLSEDLKGRLKNAKSEEEAKMILSEFKGAIEEAGLILDEEELSQVTGGNFGWTGMGVRLSRDNASGVALHLTEYTEN